MGSAATAVSAAAAGATAAAPPRVGWKHLVLALQNLVLCCELSVWGALHQALLLMCWVLQQAEPSYRATFLSHPCGSLFLAYAASVGMAGHDLGCQAGPSAAAAAAGSSQLLQMPRCGLMNEPSAVLAWSFTELCPAKQQQEQVPQAANKEDEEEEKQQQQQQQVPRAVYNEGEQQQQPWCLDRQAVLVGGVLGVRLDYLPGELPIHYVTI
jgi:hypothetical protein